MAAVDALLERIVAAPDDQATRLVYGDALGGDRGEAIVLAAQLATAGIASVDDLVYSPLEGSELEHRAMQLRKLRKLHADRASDWKAAAGVEQLEIEFRDGWPSHANVSANTIDAFARFSRRSPITSVTLRLHQQDALAAFARLPLRNVRTLELEGPVEPLDWRSLFMAVPDLHTLVWSTQAEPDELAALSAHPTLRELSLNNATDANLAPLWGSPLAQRLERLELRGVVQSWDHRPSVLAEPLRIFTGVLPSLHTVAINWISIEDAHFKAARDLVFPRTTRLTSMPFTGASIERMAPGLGGVIELDLVGAQLDDAALARIAASAPQLERLRVGGEAVSSTGVHALARLRLARLGLYDTSARVDTLANVLTEHALEAFSTRAASPLGAEFWSTLARAPHAAKLRSLWLDQVELDANTARSISGSLVGLRRLELAHGPSLGPHVDELLALPALVVLDVEDCDARPTLQQTAHPTLVEVIDLAPYATAEVRAAHHARFGGEIYTHTDMFLYLPREVTHAELGATATAAGWKFYDDNRSIEISKPKISFRIEAEHSYTELAAAIATPAAAQLIRSAACVVQIYWAYPTAAEVLPFAKTLMTELGGVLWNAAADELAGDQVAHAGVASRGA